MIPRAKDNGQSRAFNPTVAGPVVVVDPIDATSGQGTVVPLSLLSSANVQRAMSTAETISDVYRNLAQMNTDANPVIRQPESVPVPQFNPVRAGALQAAPLMPTASFPVSQVEGPVVSRPETVEMAPAAYAQPVPALVPGAPIAAAPITYQPAPITYQPAPPPPPAAGLGELVALLRPLLAERQQAPVAAAPPAVGRPWEETEKRAQATPSKLGIDFLEGPEAVRPGRSVVFNLGALGAMTTRYHDVVVKPDTITLYYDDRYAEGNKWAPPEKPASEYFELGVPHLNATFRCLSSYLRTSIGCLDILMFVKAEPQE
jgi:hypothetical protein